MAFEMLVGLQILDDDMYSAYRAAMKPILSLYNGAFGYDFRVDEVLKTVNGTEQEQKINRVFTIYFDSKAASDNFFGDADYLAVKSKFFEQSVGGTTIISSYERS